ncbi:insecticidal delta-endotoxin Cry8Ea1 family protein [Bacillus cereus]|uniref:insecticidal delta-endotoxin Cry8Ea1 family protein n=1 Tax=Bacillus cereus TaxID=1396 RepID=UPI001E596CD5|nr:insecticidal delta-endotoxin Cry8Ea1 family protein [Bacillus cereus]
MISIRLYSNYCVMHYSEGLNRIRSRGQSSNVWLDFHSFRREMTLTVLDYVSLFTFFDTVRFPVPTTSRFLSELVISSGPLGFGVNPNRTHSWQGNQNVNIFPSGDSFGLFTNRRTTIPGRNIFRVDS